MIMFIFAVVAAVVYAVVITTVGCVGEDISFALWGVAGAAIGLGVGSWAKRAV